MAGNNRNIFASDSTNYNSKSDLQKITHDLNNLLNNILNGLELVTENLDSKSTTFALLEKLKKSSLLASNIISSISNKNSPDSFNEKIRLSNIVLDTIELHELKLKNKENIIFINNVSNDFIWGSFIDIQRAILNIINNAIEADPKATINIELNQIPNEKIELWIEDNGPGISSEIAKHIFEEGFSTKKSKHSSNKGLGLNIVKEIVEQYNGNIHVESKIGKGTLFKIIFPLYKKSEFQKTYTNKTIIIGEDDPFQSEVLKDLLTSLKMTVLSATNGIEVLELLNDYYPDIIFIDKTMPIMDGLECIEKIRQMKLDIPIVITSGSDIEKFKNDGMVTEILKKPYSFEMVQNILARLI